MLCLSVVLVLLNIMLSSAFHARVSRVSSIVRSFPRFNHQLHAAFLQSMKDRENKKFVVVTGGVISGIGKGITASSVGVLMKMLGLRPTAIKIDPYLNIDAGTMSPSEHGEVFVLDDGAETDLDLGNYERFLDVSLANDSNLTTGKIYQSVIQRERNGEYLGKTVQIIPHITNEIMERILEVSGRSVDGSSNEPDVTVIELGGTIGDIESMPFVEALRQLQLLVKPENFCLIHVSMVPIVGDIGEQKTKPTQHSVKELRALGLAPDFIVCRSKAPLLESSRQKIALFCNVPTENVLSIYDVGNIYEVPLLMLQQKFHGLLKQHLRLPSKSPSSSTKMDETAERYYLQHKYLNSLVQSPQIAEQASSINEVQTPLVHSFVREWASLADKMAHVPNGPVKIALVGKYNVQGDSYLSIISALKHSCLATGQVLEVTNVDALFLEDSYQRINAELHAEAWETLKACNGILVPGGFGSRGVEGKILAAQYARTNKVPFLGICLGMQVAVIEYTRHVLGLREANSEEFNDQLRGDEKAVVFMPEGSRDKMGGTMRLGSRRSYLLPGSQAASLYSSVEVDERHRHRYEVNPHLVSKLEQAGLIFSGKDESKLRMEIIELDKSTHPFYMAAQFHPEFKSRPNRPSPLFLGFLKATLSS